MKEDHKEFKDLPPFPKLNSGRTIANAIFLCLFHARISNVICLFFCVQLRMEVIVHSVDVGGIYSNFLFIMYGHMGNFF
jgi:hypothetical protein